MIDLRTAVLVLVTVVAVGAAAGPTHAQEPVGADTAMMADVRSAFLHAWDGYVANAAGHDALRPISGTAHDWYDVSLYMTPVDAYDTMLLMGLDEEAAEAKAMVMDGLSFDVDVEVQVFEVVIRLLGGLLSAYQMDGDGRWLTWPSTSPTGSYPRSTRPPGCRTGTCTCRPAPSATR